MEGGTRDPVQVVAPCAMEGGFTFVAAFQDKSFPVTVPSGGVKEGQVLSVPYPQTGELSPTEVTPFFVRNNSSALTLYATGTAEPIGHWKDQLWDCCRLGVCHISLWNALCCPQILMAQVLTRMRMNWRGNWAPEQEWRRTFPLILALVCLFWLLTSILAPASPVWDVDENGKWVRVPPSSQVAPSGSFQTVLYNGLSWAFGIYTLIVLTKLRRMVRLRYMIPITYQSMGELEDCCLSFWCGCCSVAQMARQTADYEHQNAACCSPTGLELMPVDYHGSILTV